jgi:hypothetical protein
VNSSTIEKSKVINATTTSKPSNTPNDAISPSHSNSTGVSPTVKQSSDNLVDDLFSTQSTNPDDFKLLSKKRCKVRVHLPVSEDLIASDGDTVEIKVNVGDNIADIVDRLVQTYNLNYEVRTRVINQLNVSCCR